MNSAFLLLIVLAALFLGYKIYGSVIFRLFGLNDARPTPAHAKNDGFDYVPAKNWFILFGHHFSSIAGAGPIVGPILAVSLWGWVPSVIWIVFGSIFIGAVHDFSALIVSVRSGGRSIADVSRETVSKRARVLFLIFVWIALALVITVFASICADTFVAEPKIATSSLGLIPLALIVGFLIYRARLPLFPATIIGITGIILLIFLGERVHFTLGIDNSKNLWMIILFVYAFFASIIPVNILLQPRDYISSFLLFAGLILGSAGILITRPPMVGPAFVSFKSSQGNLVPMLFVTVACGAISGFHSLVASGTTSKQLPNESAAKKVGFGGMLLEGFLATIALITVSVAFSKAGPVTVFSQGFGQITRPLLGNYGAFLATLILNAFILTTLDTATRINRYITEELLGLKNYFLSTLLVVLFSAYLAFSGGWKILWQMFGISNQLVAALALIVLTVWLMNKGKNFFYLLIPAVFMLFVTLSALFLKLSGFIADKNAGLIVVTLCLLLLGIFVAVEGALAIGRKKKGIYA
ncbi:MAG: carbon starvation protein A [Candidatus Omnitrophica bacterium]|nr:carbon starvation protein A [Candidatus Omnitrophota bacterium]